MAVVVERIVDGKAQQGLTVDAQQLTAAVVDVEEAALAVRHQHTAEVVLRQDLQKLIFPLGGRICGKIWKFHGASFFAFRQNAKFYFAKMQIPTEIYPNIP